MKTAAKINLKDLSLGQIEELAVEFGKKRFSGRQLGKWIFNRGVDNFGLMTDLSKQFRELLAARCEIKTLARIGAYS